MLSGGLQEFGTKFRENRLIGSALEMNICTYARAQELKHAHRPGDLLGAETLKNGKRQEDAL